MIKNNFIKRHNGPTASDAEKMLKVIGVASQEQLVDEIISPEIRLPKPLNIGEGMNEYEVISHLKALGAKNKQFRTYIGLGYYNTITPGVIMRNILENPGWYTSYTPYQAEISQGRLEALLNFQTVISDLTAMPLANASLLDEGTAAAEAMLMFWHARSRAQVKAGVKKFFVANDVFPQSIEVIKTRAHFQGIEVVIDDINKFEAGEDFFGVLIQCPNQFGEIVDNRAKVAAWKEKGMQVAVAADILSLVLITPPGEWGADVVLGSNQRFGLPMGFGGPHAGYFATTEAYKRDMPGRIIGISVDALGNPAYRLALQTREQHIKRERATSNICTAQALLAIMSGFYAIYHGPDGLIEIAHHINCLAGKLASELAKYGVKQLNKYFFDTLLFELPEGACTCKVKEIAEKHGMNFRIIDKQHFGISIDETTAREDINEIGMVVAEALGVAHQPLVCDPNCQKFNGIQPEMCRTSKFMQAPLFFKYRSETDMMRYMKKLENRDLSLNRCMIPLGSCTMKLNPATSMYALSWPEFGNIHPFVPADQVEGYLELIKEMEKDLCEITGFKGMSFMPNSGASGEYAGLLTIRRYQEANGQGHRNICLIPASAHGTNPASAAMAGMQVVVVACDEHGNINLEDAKAKAEQYKDNLAAFMVTYPSTHGIYEDGIRTLVKIVHDNGGQVYMDGANMNAQVGLTSPGYIGADVCHLNLHKTFAIPHGGGGPGVGPIGVAEHLKPYLPSHILFHCGGDKQEGAVSAAPFGSAQILTITYCYIKMLGGEGLKKATLGAIMNANYLKDRLKDYYPILYTGNHGHVAHEMILDINAINKATGVAAIDIAKRLMDFGFHAPTVAFPVHETLMVEPTESEPIAELDRFVEAMIQIRKEIKDIEDGKAPQGDNIISHAPYTVEMLMADDWKFPFTRQEAGFPMKSDVQDKYFPHVTRIDDAYGDRNLVCKISAE
ncbi:MAG: aminomethyl-transferring glycine dehydrogenase [Bacteroidales bacterium]|nr:aminomethyl-transferring glycine dehydrogenase [Bacteroidales bacterium]